MRFFFPLFIFCLLLEVNCKPKKQISSTKQTEESKHDYTVGKVSHQFRDTGCPTVVIVAHEENKNPLILIPLKKLPDEMDVDGLEITFNYRPLKMPNPLGCNKGFPAELINISKK